jgi:hypothetical protein
VIYFKQSFYHLLFSGIRYIFLLEFTIPHQTITIMNDYFLYSIILGECLSL